MTHDELLAKINDNYVTHNGFEISTLYDALRGVVELHKPKEITLPNGEWGANCGHCDIGFTYPCPTIQTIEKELN